jgi:hypothetical protein
LTLVVRKRLLSRHLAVSDDARLEIIDDVVDPSGDVFGKPIVLVTLDRH